MSSIETSGLDFGAPVDITGLANGQVLFYNGSSWTNSNSEAPTYVYVVPTLVLPNTTTYQSAIFNYSSGSSGGLYLLGNAAQNTANQSVNDNISLEANMSSWELTLGSGNNVSLNAYNGSGTSVFVIGGIAWSSTNVSSYIINTFNESGAAEISLSCSGLVVATANNTMDDGSGNMTAKEIISAVGFSTVAGASASITVGASPFSYTNVSSSNQQILITGGVITSLSFSPDGGTSIAMNIGASSIILRKNDKLNVVYTTAPTLNSVQL